MEKETKDKSVTADKTILCYDSGGMYVGFCRTLNRYFKRVIYYTEYKFPLPDKVKLMIGSGFPEMERAESFFDSLKEADVVYFPDVYSGDMLEYVRSNGKRCFGTGYGEELETLRSDMKIHMKSLGLPVNPWIEIKGIDALKEYCKEKKNDNKYIKADQFRWNFESYHHVNWNQSEVWLDDLSHKLGIAGREFDFIVEDPIEGDDVVETGSDFITVDGEISDYISLGYEKKCEMYAMQFMKSSDVPEIVTGFNKVIAPTLKKYKYRGGACTEIRVGKDKVAYMIDFCSRIGSPPAEIYSEAITNWGDIIWYGAEGKLIQPEIKYKFGVQFFITSEWAIKNTQPVHFPKEIDQWVKLRNACMVDGEQFVIPTDTSLIGNVVAVGDDLDTCIKEATERAKQIEGYAVTINIAAAEDMLEIMKKGEPLGIKIDGK